MKSIAYSFAGRVGIAIRQVGCPGTTGQLTTALFPQQSVAKLWVAMTILDQVDRGLHRLDENVTITPRDFTVFNQPLRPLVTRRGSLTLSLAALLEQAITRSDNLANERLLRLAGGPIAIDRFLHAHSLGRIRFGPGENLLQSRIAGLHWSPRYMQPQAFATARRQLPLVVRRTALNAYLTAPPDGASPYAIAEALARLSNADLLSPSSTRFLLTIMAKVKTGPNRITGGLETGWKIGHKTGTGQILGRSATGFNDVALLTAPDGTRYALVIMIARTEVSIPERLNLMHAITHSLIRSHNAHLN